MRKVIIGLCFIFICSFAHAEMWICQEGSNLVKKQGDGLRLGICGKNNANILPNCIEATKEQYDEAGSPNKKLENGVLVDLTQEELDAKEKIIKDKEKEDKDKKDALVLEMKDLKFSDELIEKVMGASFD